MTERRASGPSAGRAPPAAWLIGTCLTLALFLSVGLPAVRVRVGAVARRPAPPPEPIRSQRIVWQALPPPAPPAAGRSAALPVPPAPRGAVQPQVAAPTGGRIAPDSGGSAATQAPPPVRVAAPPPSITSLPPAGRAPPAACLGPCLTKARAGFHMNGSLTRAERDSALRAFQASVPERARAMGAPDSASPPVPTPPASGLTPPMGGSVAVPLPGGGPTRAQRVHDSTLNAHVKVILDRLKLRADSARAARRRDSLEAVEKRRRDSTGVRE